MGRVTPRRSAWAGVQAEAERFRRERDEARSERDELRERVRSLESRKVRVSVPAQSFAPEGFNDARERAKRVLDAGVVCGVEFV